jgi:hypothetical protein
MSAQKHPPLGSRLSPALVNNSTSTRPNFHSAFDTGRARLGSRFLYRLLLGVGFLSLDVSLTSLAFFNFVVLFAHNVLYISCLFRLLNGTMVFHQIRFNSILFESLLLGVMIATGCTTTDDKDKQATTLRFFVETNPDPLGRSTTVVVGRTAPFQLTVEDKPFLTEVYIIRASLVERIGGYEIRVELDRQGTWLLEQYTTANIGKRIGLYSQFGDNRWLAAPMITRRIADGVLTFTPDANREEVERILRGLNNVAEEVKKER